MDDWTRVLLYGTFDGFTCSTDDLLRITVVLAGCLIVREWKLRRWKNDIYKC